MPPGCLWMPLDASGCLLGASWMPLAASGCLWVPPGCLWMPLDASGCLLGVSWVFPGSLLGVSWCLLDVSWVFPERLLGAPGSLLGVSWESPGCLLGVSWVSPLPFSLSPIPSLLPPLYFLPSDVQTYDVPIIIQIKTLFGVSSCCHMYIYIYICMPMIFHVNHGGL